MGRCADHGEVSGFVLRAMVSHGVVEMGKLDDPVYDLKSSLWVPCQCVENKLGWTRIRMVCVSATITCQANTATTFDSNTNTGKQ